jgi:hypothetical protein
VEHGLGGGDRRDEIGVDERGVDAKRDPSPSLELDEVRAFCVVHLHAPVEAAGEGGRDERLQLVVSGSARESPGHEQRLALERDSGVGELLHRGRDRAPTRVERRPWNRERRRLDDDRRTAALGHDRLERLSGEREAQGIADGGCHIGDRVDGRWGRDDHAVLTGVDERELRAGEERDSHYYNFRAYARA